MAAQATRITAPEVLARIVSGEPFTFVDTREEKAWASSSTRLPGAFRVPPDEAEAYLAQIPSNRPVVTYCTSPHENSSARVALMLTALGWPEVYALTGGYDAWQQARGPLESK